MAAWAKLTLSASWVIVSGLVLASNSGLAQVRDLAKVPMIIPAIEATSKGGTSIGAGIIFGWTKEAVLLVTAHHVVYPEGERADRIEVTFFWDKKTNHLAHIVGQRDPDDVVSDFDVLQVPMTPSLSAFVQSLDFDVLGNPDNIAPGDAVHTVGSPNGNRWFLTHSGEAFEGAAQGDMLLFESQVLAVGHSGGGLFDEDWRLIGMLTEFDRPTGKAIRLDRLLTMLPGTIPVSLSQAASSNIDVSEINFESSGKSDPHIAAFRKWFFKKYPRIGGKDIVVAMAEVDLRGDGVPEIVIQRQDNLACGSGGCEWDHLIFAKSADGWSPIAVVESCGSSIWFSRRHVIDGYPRLYCAGRRDYSSSDIQAELPPHILEWNGKRYASLQSQDLRNAEEVRDYVDRVMNYMKEHAPLSK
jgi:hypothetical protein